MSQNKILKDIAIKLGGNVGKNDNDTNELLALIRDNIGNAGGGSGSSGGGNAGIETTYAELKAMRDSSQLTPGTNYIITDYHCTTSTPDTISAGHQFDIIVVADGVNTLNEVARARLHKGDTYFADCNLAAWELKYSLDNNKAKFDWADEVNGKGVIYYMKDEFNNEVPYDFKNIKYLGSTLHNNGSLNILQDEYYYTFSKYLYQYAYSQWGSEYSVSRNSSKDTMINGELYYGFECSSNPSAWSTPYFLSKDVALTSASIIYDTSGNELSFGGNIIVRDDYGLKDSSLLNDDYVRENKIGYCAVLNNNGTSGNRYPIKLNLIVFTGAYCHNNIFADHCYNNTFGKSCTNNTFSERCYNNTFGYGFDYNILADNCSNNTFGKSCLYNVFYRTIYDNTFNDECRSIIIERHSGSCYNNTFAARCSNLKIANVDNTTFDNDMFIGNDYAICVETYHHGKPIARFYSNNKLVSYEYRDNWYLME